MPKTAVGLFKDSDAVGEVVREIESLDFPRNEIRTLGEPLDLPVTGVLSVPHIDFEVALTRELIRIGASKAEAEAYVDGVRNRGVLVLATGVDKKVDQAAQIMSRYDADRIEETYGPEPQLPGVHRPNMTPIRASRVLAGRVLEPADGGCFFVW